MKKYYLHVVVILTGLQIFVCSGQKNVTFLKGEERVDVLIRKKLFTSYLVSNKLPKPILFPLNSPSGLMLNRGYPVQPKAGESTDHPHHTGLWFAMDEVNGNRFWANTTSSPQIRHQKILQMKGGESGLLVTQSEWIDTSGVAILNEDRRMIFSCDANMNILDLNIRLSAVSDEVTVHDTKEGLLAIRVADWLNESDGNGEYLDAEGRRNEAQVWGRRSEWMRLQGEKDGQVYGIAILCHPATVNYPPYWMARGYGLFSANPVGQLVYEQYHQSSDPKPLNLSLKPGEAADFKFRILFYENHLSPERLKKLYQQYCSQLD